MIIIERKSSEINNKLNRNQRIFNFKKNNKIIINNSLNKFKIK